jgi:polyisoprenoid-binding protein YceI
MSTAATLQMSRTYSIDAAHTSAAFVIRHMMIAKVRGHFNVIRGTIELPPSGNVPTRIEAIIEVASIDTREPARDTHLKSPDFFDVERFPQIVFRSTHIEGEGELFRVHGDLTIHGTTRAVCFETTFEGVGTDPWGKQRIGYEAHTTISRKDFGLNWSQALETGGVLVGDEVRVELSVEAIAQV